LNRSIGSEFLHILFDSFSFDLAWFNHQTQQVQHQPQWRFTWDKNTQQFSKRMARWLWVHEDELPHITAMNVMENMMMNEI
jgi:hypothetical protein